MSTSLSEFKPVFPQPTLLSVEDRERVAEICATVGAVHQHGGIYFGVCNNRLKIEAIEEALEKSLAAKGITISRVVLAERHDTDAGPQYRIQIPDPVTYLSEQEEREHTLFFIHGLPELIRAETQGDYSKVASVSQLLNYRRELFHDRALCAFFWLDPETVPYLRQNARDFWAFRSGTAFFLETETPTHRPHWSLGHENFGWTGPYDYLEQKLSQLAAYRRRSPPDDNAIGNLLLDIGRLHAQRHESQSALEWLHEALAIFEALSLEDKVRESKLWIARTFEGIGRLDKAEAYLHETIEIDTRRADEASLATDYNNLSQLYLARGQFEKAEKWERKAMEIDERLGDESKLAIRYDGLGQIYHAWGQLDEAEKWLRKAIEIDERLGDEAGLAADYYNLNVVYQGRGQVQEAEEWLRKAIEINERLGDEPKLAAQYSNLSLIFQGRRQSEEAEKWVRKAIEIAERLGDEAKLAVGYNNLGQIYYARGQLEEAEKWLRKAISLMEPKGPSAVLEGLRRNLDTLLKERQHQTDPQS